MRRHSNLFVIVACAVGTLACQTSTQEEGSTLRAGSDLFSFGSNVHLTEPASGDVIAAGEWVEIGQPVAGDAVVAGRHLTLNGPFASDLYAVGEQVDVDGAVGGSLRAAGRTVRLGPKAELGAGVSIAAGDAELAGTFEDYLQVAAGTTRLDAQIAGDVEVAGRSLDVGPSTVVGGSLTFHGPVPPNIAAGAQIAGETTHIAEAARPDGSQRALGMAFGIAWLLGLGVVGTLAYALLPGFTRSVGAVVRRHPGRSLLVGSALWLAFPLGILCSFLSLIGVPLGLLALYLYLLFVPIGFLTSCMALADLLLQRVRPRAEDRVSSRALTLVLVLAGLAVLATLPWLGLPLGLLLAVVGLGGLASSLWDRFRPRRSSEPVVETPNLKGRDAAHET
jgi:hypothetical protein